MRFFDITSLMRAGALVAVMAILLTPMTVFAWGDNSEDGKGRPSYTIDEINEGAIGATSRSDGENYKNSGNYPGQIIFNAISDSTIGSEKNFVAARECILLEDGSWEGATKDTVWNGNDIAVEDGKYYIIRLYVHNNNPNGQDAVAEDTHVSFSIPNEYDKENGRIQVNGFIDSSNAIPSEYWDYVNFNSEIPFHLEFINNSGLLENNGIGLGGLILSDDVVKAKSGGVLIGYDALDGRVPGCYQYANYVTIKVKVVYDYDFTVEKKVRLAGKKEWKDSIEAKIGDEVELQIKYVNNSDYEQKNVLAKDIIQSDNLVYVKGSAKIENVTYPDGTKIDDSLISTGVSIGNYKPGETACIVYKATIADNNLTDGANTLVNWTQTEVGSTIMQDYATVVLYKYAAWFQIAVTTLLALIAICLTVILILTLRKIYIKRHL